MEPFEKDDILKPAEELSGDTTVLEPSEPAAPVIPEPEAPAAPVIPKPETPAEPEPKAVTGPEPVVHQAPEMPPRPTVAAEAPKTEPETQYRGRGVGRKESPFADSPYVMNHRPASAAPHSSGAYAAPASARPAKAPAARKKKMNGGWKKAIASILVLVLIGTSCGITAAVVNNRWERELEQLNEQFNQRMDRMQLQVEAAVQAAQNSPAAAVSGTTDGLTPGQVYAQNVQSVVLITCEVTADVYGQTTTGTSAGSGFILTENGYIVTNHHVVEGATRIYVGTHDGEEYAAQLIGSDATNDVAVLKVDAQGLDAVVIGSSEALAVGDQVVAIGNPLGELTSTMTAGYVSAKNRDVTTDGRTINMIQTDAAINSGNSGGPLFNMNGEVVGITTAKYSGASSSGASIEGIGFAIPMDDVIGMVEDLVNFGYVTGAYLGVMVSDMDAEAAAYYGMPVGAYVQEVTPGYCAQRAGLQAKDIIVALGEYEVKNVSGLTRALRNFSAGDTTTITVFRSGKQVVLTITLDEKPAAAAAQNPIPEGDPQMPEEGSFEEWYNYFAPFFGYGKND